MQSVPSVSVHVSLHKFPYLHVELIASTDCTVYVWKCAGNDKTN